MIFLEFEKPIEDLHQKIQELRHVQTEESALDISKEIDTLTKKSHQLLKNIYQSLSPWQISQVARHPARPYSLDFIRAISEDFTELHGDRLFADDPAIVGGIGRFEGESVMFIGHQKGRDLKERTFRNFGMPKPEGYRKAARLMKTAEKFLMPVITFIDTPGAYPGIGAEERGQSEAIGRNLFLMSGLKVPIISIVIGEGGSGGALAIAVADRLLMFEFSIYSVISPEGCASILWKDSEKAEKAADTLAITAGRLHELGLIDLVLAEPLGGNHRNYGAVFSDLKREISKVLGSLRKLKTEKLVKQRQDRIRGFGRFSEIS